MEVSQAIVSYIQTEVIPGIAGRSELTAAILNGVLNASRKKIAEKVGSLELLQSLGVTGSDGSADPEVLKDFVEGMFQGRDSVSVNMAEVVKILTGVESASPLLQGKLTFRKADGEKFLEYLNK